MSAVLTVGQARRVALVADSHGSVQPAVLAALGAIAPVLAIRGNNDTPARWPRGEQAACAALPDTLCLQLGEALLAVVHGHRWPAVATRHARLRAAWPQARWVVYGHSHRRVVDDAALPWVLNPGACGQARAHGGAGWLELRRTARGWRIWQPD